MITSTASDCQLSRRFDCVIPEGCIEGGAAACEAEGKGCEGYNRDCCNTEPPGWNTTEDLSV